MATWKTPNAAYVSLTDAANWVEGVVPHQAGDIGTIAGTDPIRVAVDHDVAWEGTLKLTRANPSFLQRHLKLPEIDFFGLVSAVFLRKSLISNAGFLM